MMIDQVFEKSPVSPSVSQDETGLAFFINYIYNNKKLIKTALLLMLKKMPEIIFTDQNFENEVIKSDKPVLVDFWAPWCGPCQIMGPIISELAKEYEGKNIKVGKMNVDENPETSAKYNILSIPTFKIFKNGKSVAEMMGSQAKEKIKAELDKVLA